MDSLPLAPLSPVAELQPDFALLRSAVTDAHAGLFVYESSRAIAHVFDSALAGLQDTTRLGFYGVVAGVLAQIRDGHTRSLPSEKWMQWYADSARILPLRIRVAEGRGWVIASADPGVDLGSEALAISGRTPGQIAAHILSRLELLNSRMFKKAIWRMQFDAVSTGTRITCGVDFTLRFLYLFLMVPLVVLQKSALRRDLTYLKRALESSTV